MNNYEPYMTTPAAYNGFSATTSLAGSPSAALGSYAPRAAPSPRHHDSRDASGGAYDSLGSPQPFSPRYNSKGYYATTEVDAKISRKQSHWSAPTKEEDSFSYQASFQDSDEDEYEYVDRLVDGVIYRVPARGPTRTTDSYRGQGTDQYYHSQGQSYRYERPEREVLEESPRYEPSPRRRRQSSSTPRRHTVRQKERNGDSEICDQAVPIRDKPRPARGRASVKMNPPTVEDRFIPRLNRSERNSDTIREYHDERGMSPRPMPRGRNPISQVRVPSPYSDSSRSRSRPRSGLGIGKPNGNVDSLDLPSQSVPDFRDEYYSRQAFRKDLESPPFQPDDYISDSEDSITPSRSASRHRRPSFTPQRPLFARPTFRETHNDGLPRETTRTQRPVTTDTYDLQPDRFTRTATRFDGMTIDKITFEQGHHQKPLDSYAFKCSKISKDNTIGESARKADLLAGYGQRFQRSAFKGGVAEDVDGADSERSRARRVQDSSYNESIPYDRRVDGADSERPHVEQSTTANRERHLAPGAPRRAETFYAPKTPKSPMEIYRKARPRFPPGDTTPAGTRYRGSSKVADRPPAGSYFQEVKYAPKYSSEDVIYSAPTWDIYEEEIDPAPPRVDPYTSSYKRRSRDRTGCSMVDLLQGFRVSLHKRTLSSAAKNRFYAKPIFYTSLGGHMSA
ncbi:hypothetical protein G7Y89_g15661 [Cudoniella acicularis]|uniref:Uncharacterized protein n=1 Tax=Cudoniella acicularis TaxID=354080 RepID=A0A8H4VIX2_9HELO|nr:hypothetical protein G7Y89_g15661 [Cudoniella acicularis]